MNISGTGTGYAMNDSLVFNGMTAHPMPTAHIGSVSNGNPTSVVVSNGGIITGAAGSVDIAGPVEYVSKINASRLSTTHGNSYNWALRSPHGQSAFIQAYQ